MRLQSYLSKCGVTSRRKAAELVEQGKVTVNGQVVKEPGFAMDPEKDKVIFGGKTVHTHEKAYYMFHKPRNVITTVSDTHGRKTVADYFKKFSERLYPVGRLDRDTTGLLIMTNDGDFALRMTHPRYGQRKIYEMTLAKALSEEQRRKAEKGLWLEGESRKTAPCTIKFEGKLGEAFKYKVTLHEGKKRQIREMMKIICAPLVTLHRNQVGSLTLGDLKPGHFRPLSSEEIEMLLSGE